MLEIYFLHKAYYLTLLSLNKDELVYSYFLYQKSSPLYLIFQDLYKKIEYLLIYFPFMMVCYLFAKCLV
jgi:hypothetical protein